MELDEQAIRQQLHDLSRERAEIGERLKATDRSGRRLHPPHFVAPPVGSDDPPPGPSLFDRIRPADRGQYQQRGPYAQQLPGPPGAAQGGPRNAGGDGGAIPRGSTERLERVDRFDRRRKDEEPKSAQLPPPPARKRLSSAVIVDGEAKAPTMAKPEDRIEAELRIAKRPAPSERAEDNPAAKRRNMRMFGALMGTLQKFKSEEVKNRDSEAVKKREEALQRAKQKAKDTAQQLRNKERQEMLLARLADVDRRRQLMFEFEIKRLELLFVQSVSRKAEVAMWLKTKAGPSVCWAPVKFDEHTMKLQEGQRELFNEWKEKQAQRLKEDRAAILQREHEASRRAEERRKAIVEGRRPDNQRERFSNGHQRPAPMDVDEQLEEGERVEEEDTAGQHTGVDADSDHEQAVEAEEAQLREKEEAAREAGDGEVAAGDAQDDEGHDEPDVIDHEKYDPTDRYQGHDEAGEDEEDVIHSGDES